MSAHDLAARVDELRRQPDAAPVLVGMLSEQSPSYAGRGTNETERVRGYVLASFESAGLPPEGMPFVLEELELGNNPYTVAGAARALRGAREVPADAPALLVRAIERLRGADDVVWFDRFTLNALARGPGHGAHRARTLGPCARPGGVHHRVHETRNKGPRATTRGMLSASVLQGFRHRA